MQAMIFAAGKGTRLKPLTDVIPKALVPVGDKPLLQIVTERLVDAGADNIVVNVHHHAGQIKNMLWMMAKAYPVDIRISDESMELLETGGGIKKARPLFNADEPVLIHNCDILSDLDLRAFYNDSVQSGAAATLVVSERKTQRYLLFSSDMRLVGWTNNGGIVPNPGQLLMNAVLGLAQPIFAGGRLKANLKIAKLQQQEAANRYVETMLRAGSEVNDAIFRCRNAREQDELYQRLLTTQQESYHGTCELMKKGKANYLEVLTAQENYLKAQLADVTNRYNGLISLIDLYIALGGGTK